ncbi:MAG: TPM domain-containing protein [Enterococcus sp.]|uniref:TPM domain-containing protein n=1 Tax=Enterococcus sp. TaxID=35783 RepID=UPI00264924C2|nr:TPM domain-containing protein [Enterococcus sp.]MDN6217595.1 TPM domain-containing protein [Enterococcus sp.]
MKKFLFIMGFLALFTPLTVFAASNTVDDQANLFSPEERTELSNQADAINQKIKGEVFVLTTNSNTEDPQEFADLQLMDRVGKDNNGALLLLDMNQRKIHLSTSGNMIDYLNDKRVNTILDSVEDAMTDKEN